MNAMDELKQRQEAARKANVELLETMSEMLDVRKLEFKQSLSELDEKYKEELAKFKEERDEITAAFNADTRDIRAQIKVQQTLLEGGRINTKKIVRQIINGWPDELWSAESLAQKAIALDLITEHQKDRFAKAVPISISAALRNNEDWLQEIKDGDGVAWTGPDPVDD